MLVLPTGAAVRCLAAAAAVLLALAGCSASRSSAPAAEDGRQIFGPASEWRRDVTAAPLNPDSPAMTADLAGQVRRYYGTAAFNVTRYNSSIAVASRRTPRVRVAFDDCQHKGYVPDQLYDRAKGAYFDDVPIPAGAKPADGTDQQLTVWSPSTDQLWEFWVTEEHDGRWSACWGGRLDHASRSPGWFPDGMGATATGMASAGGMVRIEEARTGRIDHALALQLPEPAAWWRFSYPAQRSDGPGEDAGPDDIPEGLRLRLDPSVDVRALHLHPVAAAIARAAQKYGFIVTDKSGAVSVAAESSAGVRDRTGRDPWAALLRGTPDYQVMRGFPWDRVQALPFDYGRP